MSVSIQAAPTVGEIARRFGVSVHQVEYVVKSRKIQAASVAGNARIFAEHDVAYIGSELRRIAEEREGGGL